MKRFFGILMAVLLTGLFVGCQVQPDTYTCLQCGIEYGTEAEAAACAAHDCTCPQCGTVYGTKADAESCAVGDCTCSICNKVFNTKAEAEAGHVDVTVIICDNNDECNEIASLDNVSYHIGTVLTDTLVINGTFYPVYYFDADFNKIFTHIISVEDNTIRAFLDN